MNWQSGAQIFKVTGTIGGVCYFLIVFCGCYSFKGISIPPELNTFYVEDFVNRAPNAPGAIDQSFSEALRTKVRNESRLNLVDIDPDIVFQGSISRFQVSSEAPQAGNTVSFNKLTIGVEVEYINARNEKDTWKQTFSFFRDFESNADLQSLQDGFIAEIFRQITEDVFNRAFTNW